MKKPLIVLCCLIGIVISTQAQSLILKAGGSLANVGSIIETKNKPGIVAGLAFEIPLSSRFSIQPELLFHQKGFKEDGSLEESDPYQTYFVDFKSSFTLNYLELPVLVKYKFGIFYVNGGSSISYGIGGKYSLSPDGGSTLKGKMKFGHNSTTLSNEDTDFYIENALDLGLQVGGGVKIFKRIIIDARYGFGLSSPYDKNDMVSFKKDKSHNRSFQLTLGYPIKLGKR